MQLAAVVGDAHPDSRVSLEVADEDVRNPVRVSPDQVPHLRPEADEAAVIGDMCATARPTLQEHQTHDLGGGVELAVAKLDARAPSELMGGVGDEPAVAR